MSDWIALATATSVVALVILAPGLLIAAVLGLHGAWRWALAFPAGASVVGLSTLIAGLVGMRWSIIPVAVTFLAVILVCAGIRRFLLGQPPRAIAPSNGARSPYAIAVVVAAVILSAQFIILIGSPTNISQTFDNVFHLNAVRYILDTANASPLWVGTMTSAPTGGVPFYPSLWHALGALVVQLTGVSIPVASNAILLFFATLSWPSGILLLARVLAGGRTAGAVTAVAVAVGAPAFPLLMADYGVLYPYLAGLALLPAVLATLAAITTGSREAGMGTGIVAVVGSIPGIAIAHPGAFVALLVFGSVVLLFAFVRFLRASPLKRQRNIALIGAVLYAGVAVAAWYVLRPPAAARTWGQTESMGQALGEVLAGSPWSQSVNIVILVLSIAGLVTALRRRSLTGDLAIALFISAAGLYIVVSGLPYWTIRDILTGAWYNNAPRLAALLPIAWVPLAAIGGDSLWTWLRARLDTRRASSSVIVAVASILAVVTVALPQVINIRESLAAAQANYRFAVHSPLLTADELALIERIPDLVDEDVRVAGSSWTGAGLVYALADRPVLMPHTLMDYTEDIDAILDSLDEATPGSAVCEAVGRENVGYVLDFGTQEVNGGSHPFEGFDSLGDSDAVELVDEEGDARLYEVVGCD
ncbi:DUF6541 family protein [Microbacterium sp. YY-03]|uniref:DUF6541 family protein n=1 Tax=Microbacterium sp. YY-03 TaxID=3421636 RepID=UPI003D174854